MKIAMFAVLGILTLNTLAAAVQRTWIGGNANWDLTNANWTGGDEPDSDDEALFNTANSVHLANAFEQLLGLNLSGGIDLFTNDNDMSVFGPVQLTGANTNLFIQGNPSLFVADDLTINSGADVRLIDGSLTVNKLVGSGLLDVNAGGTLSGWGAVNLNDAVTAGSILLVNDGTISAVSDPIGHQTAPPLGTFSINASDADTRIDLDGATNTGTVQVMRNQTLDINVPLASGSFRGSMNLFQNSTLDIPSWNLTGGTITIDNGFLNNPLPDPDIPAGVAFLNGFAFTQAGGTINVLDGDGTLQFNTGFTQNGGTFVNNGQVVFNAPSVIGTRANFTMPSANSSITVNPGVTVNIDQADFDADGTGTPTNVIRIENGGVLDLSLGAGGDRTLEGTILLNGGALAVTPFDNSWSLGGTVRTGLNSGISQLNGHLVILGSDSMVVAGGSTLEINAPSTWIVGSNFQADGVLELNAPATFNLTNAGGFGVGGGTLRINSSSTVASSANIFVDTFDWDGTTTGQTHTIQLGQFIISSPHFDDDGDMDDAIVMNPGASLVVNGPAQWEMRGTLTSNVPGGTGVTITGLSRMILASATGVFDVDGDTIVGSPITFGAASVTRIDAGTTLTIDGGDQSSARSNKLEGGTIFGPGRLRSDPGHALSGFGTIDSSIEFVGNTGITAIDGMLTINGQVLDVHSLGAGSGGAILNMVNPWNTNVASFVTLIGGELRGGLITNDGELGIHGRGLLTAQVINNRSLEAFGGGTLVVQTPNNGNDWDGSSNLGILRASTGGTLELRDNAAFNFLGDVIVREDSTVFVNGFALEFDPGSNLSISGTYHANEITRIAGNLSVGLFSGGNATLQVDSARLLVFEETSVSSIDSPLKIVSTNALIRVGATMNGLSNLNIAPASVLNGESRAAINVGLVNEGILRISSTSVGQFDVARFQQKESGAFFVDVSGPGPGEFDHLVVSNDAQLAGKIALTLRNGFIPEVGDIFSVLSAAAVSGEFNNIQQSASLPPNRFFDVLYFSDQVQLKVIEALGDFNNDHLFNCADLDSLVAQIAAGTHPIDFDLNGDSLVSLADLNVWLANAGIVNLASNNAFIPGDANLDGIVDGSDFNIWNSHKFTSAAAWCSGDFSADGVVDGSDFNIWNSHKFTASDSTLIVPEPGTCFIVVGLAVHLSLRIRSRAI
jgi:hypothetical protein